MSCNGLHRVLEVMAARPYCFWLLRLPPQQRLAVNVACQTGMTYIFVCAAKAKKSMWQSLSEDVLRNPFVWLFSLSYFFVYVVRQGVTSWFVFYLSVSPFHVPAHELSTATQHAGELLARAN